MVAGSSMRESFRELGRRQAQAVDHQHNEHEAAAFIITIIVTVNIIFIIVTVTAFIIEENKNTSSRSELDGSMTAAAGVNTRPVKRHSCVAIPIRKQKSSCDLETVI
ncbi:hypothetical protein E2C01_020005 [Portunus trituberculatus]|uniref:Uncharacterized protein n=1 Tax=Portunus trituberculatus TaxID=210409 RepID=A0A5B7E058_PORTR|nr:hypothetical protein [Portunus trituberculatus]